MSASVLVFDGHDGDDPASANSRWIAEQTARVLAPAARVLRDGEAQREGLTRALGDGGDAFVGVVLCGHGDGGKDVFVRENQYKTRDEDWRRRHEETSAQGAVYGSDGEPALDEDNVAVLRARWAHVQACSVGAGPLPSLAVDAGATVFVAYEQRLVPEFEVATLPQEALDALSQVVTATSRQLREGAREERAMRIETRRASRAILAWIDSEDGERWCGRCALGEVSGLTQFATQMYSALVLRGPTQTDQDG